MRSEDGLPNCSAKGENCVSKRKSNSEMYEVFQVYNKYGTLEIKEF